MTADGGWKNADGKFWVTKSVERKSTTITMPVNYIEVKSLFKEGFRRLINWGRSIFNFQGREVMTV